MQRISNQFDGRRPNIKSMADVQGLLENWHDKFQNLFERLGSGKILGGEMLIGDAENGVSISLAGILTFMGTAGLSYGEISAYDEGDEIAIATAGIANKVQVTTFDTNGPTKNTTPDHTNDHITVISAGHYFCIVSLHIESAGGGGADEFGFGVYKNNGTTLFENCHGHRKLAGGGGDTGALSLSGLLDLAVGDTIELWCWNEDSTDNIIIDDVTMTLIQFGGT